MKMTKRDMKLIQCLRSDARQTLTQISRKTKIPISTLFDRLKAQNKSTILKHATLINFHSLGYGTRVQMMLRVDPMQREELQKHLTFHDQVNNVFEVAQGYDFVVEAIFKEVQDVRSFIDSLQQRFQGLDYSTHFITRDLKREGFLAQ